ncbi:hypothetical protein AVEN_209807-1 [Araneus ventricosus]|uniref:Uncharacterized protein n=1 Tax=Araneus ventricosus TaxID=182803 RepID=A0A4Y2T541_ARAVE|nr:hypothetical protein AVEN_209807-1 [Araneus ventricosus]
MTSLSSHSLQFISAQNKSKPRKSASKTTKTQLSRKTNSIVSAMRKQPNCTGSRRENNLNSPFPDDVTHPLRYTTNVSTVNIRFHQIKMMTFMEVLPDNRNKSVKILKISCKVPLNLTNEVLHTQ